MSDTTPAALTTPAAALSAWEAAMNFPRTAVTMPNKVRQPLPYEGFIRERTILSGKRDALGQRPDQSDDSMLQYCGRPRNPKPRRRTDLSMFDAHYTWQG